MDMLMNVDLY